MLVDEMSSGFSKKSNYSHCPLKKRPVNFVLFEEDRKMQVKEEKVNVVDTIPEPENLSTKPQDLSRTSAQVKRTRSPSPAYYKTVTRTPSPVTTHRLYKPYQPNAGLTPPHSETPVHPVAKKARVEIVQYSDSYTTPVEPLSHYAWARVAAPMYPPQYLPYQTAYRYASELYSTYPVPAYPLSSPEHQSVSPSPPHVPVTPAQRPIARPWTSPEPCALSPTNSLSSVSLHSPMAAEDLSSDSGRSSAGSISVESKLSTSPSDTTAPRYQCPDCGKSYSTYSGLSKHQQFHCAAADGQAKKTFTCKYCEKVYLTLGALKMHIRTHTLPCKCHLCGKAFSRPWLLQGHIRTHTGEKPFSCQHCNRAFADRSNLRAHLQTHSDVKKYSCANCSKTFSRMSLLTKHQEAGCPGLPAAPGAPLLPAYC